MVGVVLEGDLRGLKRFFSAFRDLVQAWGAFRSCITLVMVD